MFFVDSPQRVGGAQRSLFAVLQRLPAHGIAPIAVFPAPGRCEAHYRAGGIECLVIPGPPSFHVFEKGLLRRTKIGLARVVLAEIAPYSMQLAKRVRELDIDVCHFNTARGILSAGLAAKFARRPSVLHVRGAMSAIHAAPWLAAQALADRIVLVARTLLDDVALPFRRRATVVYNGVEPPRDLPSRTEARARLASELGVAALAEREATLVLSLSSYTPYKGLHHLIDAFDRVHRERPRAQLLALGNEGERAYVEWLRREVARRGLTDRVHLAGYYGEPFVALAAADLLVLPTVFEERVRLDDGTVLEARCTEGLPRSVLESMAARVPVIATDVAGVREQIDDRVTGLVVPPSDPTALAHALAELLDDAARRAELAAGARVVVENRFSLEAATRGLADVLQGVSRR